MILIIKKIFITFICLLSLCSVNIVTPNLAIAQSSWSAKSAYKQVSCYGPYEGETITATGKYITNDTKYIAVPYQRIVSKKTWKHLSKKNKYKYFYYGQKIRLSRGNKHIIASVQDCGGFLNYGCYYKGKWRQRLFDLTPAVFNKLKIYDIGLVKFQWKK